MNFPNSSSRVNFELHGFLILICQYSTRFCQPSARLVDWASGLSELKRLRTLWSSTVMVRSWVIHLNVNVPLHYFDSFVFVCGA